MPPATTTQHHNGSSPSPGSAYQRSCADQRSSCQWSRTTTKAKSSISAQELASSKATSTQGSIHSWRCRKQWSHICICHHGKSYRKQGSRNGREHHLCREVIHSPPLSRQSSTNLSCRPKPQGQGQFEEPQEKKKPRKLEMRLNTSSPDAVSFSAPFLDNTLQKMLTLQNRMLRSTADLAKTAGVEEKVIKEQASQSAELSRIIALICAEKARQGA